VLPGNSLLPGMPGSACSSSEGALSDTEEAAAIADYQGRYKRRRSRAVLYQLSGTYRKQQRKGKLQLNTKVCAATAES